jgi:hypothetical protein
MNNDELIRFRKKLHEGKSLSRHEAWKTLETVTALQARLAEVEAERDKARRDANMARYGQPDFAWSIHREAMADLLSRAEAAEARVKELEEALREIARQKKTDEVETECGVEYADFEGGYDMCIARARAALAAMEKEKADE